MIHEWNLSQFSFWTRSRWLGGGGRRRRSHSRTPGADPLYRPGNNEVLAAATEFKVARALQTYMGNQVLINGVDVVNDEEKLRIVINYTKTKDLQQQQATFELLPAEVLGGA